MRKVERLRVVLVAGAAVLLLAVVGWLGYARYRAAKSWLNRMPKGATLERETDGFTYSQSVQGKTLFTLHAAKAFQHKDGKWTLRDVVLTMYGLHADRADRIYGDEFEWDESKGVARAIGEVQMDLQVPPGVASAERHGGASDAAANAGGVDSVHVRTSGLVFIRQLGVAATDEPIEFRYGGIVCTAVGAEFDQSPSTLHLLAKVHAEGELRGTLTTLTANSAEFRRDTNVLTLATLRVATPQQTASADTAVLQLRSNSSVQAVQLAGDVQMAAPQRGLRISAPRLESTFSVQNQPEQASMSGGVRWDASAAASHSTGSADSLHVQFNAKAQPEKAIAVGAVHFVSQQLDSRREVSGNQGTASFATYGKGHTMARELLVSGDARAQSDVQKKGSGKGGVVTTMTLMGADTLRAVLVPEASARMRVDVVYGEGHASVSEQASDGTDRKSTADRVEVHLRGVGAGGADEIASADESGHVLVTARSATKANAAAGTALAGPMHASADAAHFDAAFDLLTLKGKAMLDDAGRSVASDTVLYHRTSGDAEAAGHVSATVLGTGDRPASHITAERATMTQANGRAQFSGAPARLFQGASQVEAGEIELDRKSGALTATPAGIDGWVNSTFAGGGAPAAKSAANAQSAAQVLRVRSRRLLYASGAHRATFDGPVTMNANGGILRGDHADAFFATAANAPRAGNVATATANAGVDLQGSALDHVVVTGDVHVTQPGREADGTQLVYKAGDGSFLLTGTATAPPHAHDAVQGDVTGASLLLRPGDTTIVVSGTTAADGTKAAAGGVAAGRARIETRVRQKAQ